MILSGLMTKVSIIITSNCISYAGKYRKEWDLLMLASHGSAICHEHHDKRIVAGHGNFQEF